MSDPAAPARTDCVHTVRLGDGRAFGPADAELLLRWAREGRVPRDAMIESTDGAPPVRAAEHPALRTLLGAPPITPGPVVRGDPIQDDGGLGVLIPYRNGFALGAYYTGVFSLIPIIGMLLGPVALVLGVLGLKFAARHPRARGRVHAWVGIVLGGLVFVAHIGVIIFAVLRSA